MTVSSGTLTSPPAVAPDGGSLPGTYAKGPPRAEPPGTLTALFFDAIERYDKPDAMQVKKNGTWSPI